jgi:hypothetical protein
MTQVVNEGSDKFAPQRSPGYLMAPFRWAAKPLVAVLETDRSLYAALFRLSGALGAHDRRIGNDRHAGPDLQAWAGQRRNARLAAKRGWDTAGYEAAKTEAVRIAQKNTAPKPMLAIWPCFGL